MSSPSPETNKHYVTGTVNHHQCEPETAAASLQLTDPLQLAGAKKQSNKDLLKHANRSFDAVEEDRFSSSSNSEPPIGLPPLGKATAFAQFVQQGWEAYMNDPNADAAFPLQLLCGASGGYERLEGPYAPLPDGHLLAPAALRHTHSSPLKYGAPIFARSGDDVPPPIPLDPFQRSSSTPSSFRQRSTNSAFTDRVPSQRASYTSIVSKPDSRLSAFDPVKYYARALEDMERTSIEVADVTPAKGGTAATAEVNSRVGAATRAARFLSDVRILRRRRRAIGGRDNPATPASNSSSSRTGSRDSKEADSRALDTSVTVITEPNAPETSLLSQSSELSALLKQESESEDDKTNVRSSAASDSDKGIAKEPSSESDPYHRLDSDVDEEEIHFRSLYQSTDSESPGTVPSPAYLPMIDERVPSSEGPSKSKIRIRLPEEKPDAPCVTTTPSPTRMNRVGSTTPRSNDSANVSPGTRSSATGSSSGHTTQATISTLSSGPQSGLSTISETDREVMQANADGKRRRRGLESLRALRKLDPDPATPEADSLNSSSTSTTSNPTGYIALANSPVPLREGANVPADRFFTHSPSNASALVPASINRAAVPLRRIGLSGSPGTVETASESHTTLSGSNIDEVPPKFVSYMDREGTSDLTSLRGVEVSTKRGDNDKTEEREDSPAEFVKYPELIFANSGAASPIPRPLSAKGQRYRTTRPPRTPTKGLLPRVTPPPRGAVSPSNQHSPPCTSVDHPSVPSTNAATSDPQTLDSAPADESLVDSSPPPDGPLLYIAEGYVSPVNYKDDELQVGQPRGVRGRTYADGSVEILKASSPNSSPPTLVTPEKNAD